MATFTASYWMPNPPAHHIGGHQIGGNVSTSNTGTASSIVILCVVPNKATIFDWWIRVSQGGASQTIALGTSASPSGIAAPFSLSDNQLMGGSTSGTVAIAWPNSVFRAPGPGVGGTTPSQKGLLPVRVSVSDDVTPALVTLQAELGVAISATLSMEFMVEYRMGLPASAARTTIR